MKEHILGKEIVMNKSVSRLIGAATFVILMSLGAFVRIPLPFTPIPLTLQTFFVLLSGAFLGSRLGAMTQLSYILLGVFGVPVFSGAGSGLFYLLGPTGGYLMGFILSALFLGRFIGRRQTKLFSVFGLFCLGDLIILVCGTVWLKLLLGYSFIKLLSVGLIPFAPGDLLKAGVASLIYLKLCPRLKEIF
jgi:biotin transport system substrate-specific component